MYLPKQSKTIPYVLFIKLDDKANSLIDYDFTALEIKSNEETDDIPNIENSDNSNLTVEKEQDISDTATNNPQTGSAKINSVVIFSSLLLISVFLILKRKNKLFKV